MKTTVPLLIVAVCISLMVMPAADAANGLSGYASNDQITVTYVEDTPRGPEMFITLAKLPQGNTMSVSIYTTAHWPVQGLEVPVEKSFGVITGTPLLEQTYTVYIAQGSSDVAQIDVTIGHQTIYKVDYLANGGKGSMTPSYVGSGGEVILSGCTFTAPEGKEFKAWSIDGSEYREGSSMKLTSDKTATAVWQDASSSDLPVVAIIGVVVAVLVAALIVVLVLRRSR